MITNLGVSLKNLKKIKKKEKNKSEQKNETKRKIFLSLSYLKTGIRGADLWANETP